MFLQFLIKCWTLLFWPNKAKQSAHVQKKVLERILKNIRGLEIEKELGLAGVHSISDYQTKIPAREHSDLKNIWGKATEQKVPLVCHDQLVGFALSSGTTGQAKQIPVSLAGMRAWKKMQLRLVGDFLVRHPHVKLFGKNRYTLMVAARATIEKTAGGYDSGMISGIYRSHTHPWLASRFLPSLPILNLEDWEEKMRQMAQEALLKPVSSLSGLPSVLVEFLQFSKKTLPALDFQKLVEPIQILIVSGTNYRPYKNTLKELIGHPIEFLEIYAASEGFIGRPVWDHNLGDRPIFQLNWEEYFFEFLPFEQYQQGQMLPKLLLHQLQENVKYVLLITNGSGAFSYVIGDVVLCVRAGGNPWLELCGRAQLQLNLVGEKTSVPALEQTVLSLQSKFPQWGAAPQEFAVVPVWPDKGLPHYHWVLEESAWSRLDLPELSHALDAELSQQNGVITHSQGTLIGNSQVSFVSSEKISDWLKLKGKQKGHQKFPRICLDAQFLNEIQS